MPRRGATAETERIVHVNQPGTNLQFCSNRVVTSKYTVFTFLPIILFNHLRRFMNLYFIILGCLQMWKDVSPVDPLTTWIPIAIIFAIAFTREGYDDYRQHQIDKKTNTRPYKLIREGQIVDAKSEDILVGDLIILDKNKEAPADFVLIYTSDTEGTCSIETANLDGETNLKQRFPLQITQAISREEINLLHPNIQCIPPNANLYQFSGNFLNSENTHPLTKDNFIQSGAFLRNVDYVIGAVVYTGPETKLGLNCLKPPVKWTKIERFLDKISVFIFIAQWCVALITGTIGSLFAMKVTNSMTYLRIDLGYSPSSAFSWLIFYVRFYLLTSMMIPISLKVTIDVSKAIYGLMITSDRKMVDRERSIYATVNNSSVIEDLGSIEYVFSDKTGTLTENVMELKKLSINGVYYGHGKEAETIYEDTMFESNCRAKDHSLLMSVLTLALCHTVKIIGPDELVSVSPEETAFIRGLFKLGFNIAQLPSKRTTIEAQKYNLSVTEFETLLTLPFSYERKRMSVIVRRTSDNKMFLMSKGAGEIIFKLCSVTFSEYRDQMLSLASTGLRVMGLSYRDVTEDEYAKFTSALSEAQRDLENRTKKEEAAYEAFEANSTLLGCGAIEDRLQEAVPETIAMLRDAHIKVWMITGDILQTALKISYSTNLVQNDGPFINLSRNPRFTINEMLDAAENIISRSKSYYLAIQGSTDEGCLDELLNEHKEQFLRIASDAKCVVLARSTPRQKAAIVEAIQSRGKMTLAVGDGGNDVQMIRAAHIGVGIVGKEGMQAAAAGDFSVTHFRFLQRLLLIHGRFSYYRTSWLAQFCFYKSTLLALIQVAFIFQNGFSGSSFFNSFNLMCYNAIFTILPVIFFLVDKDLEENTVFLHPYVYIDSQRGLFCCGRTLFWWYFRGIYQAIVIVLLTFKIFDYRFAGSDGGAISLEEVQQTVYSALIFIVCFTVTMDTKHFTSLNLVFIWGSWVLYILLAAIANMISDINIIKEMYQAMWRVIADPVMWAAMLTLVSIAVMPPFIVDSLTAIKCPTRTQQLRSMEVRRSSRFDPIYMVSSAISRDDSVGLTERSHPESIWDSSPKICPAAGTALRSILCCSSPAPESV